MNLILNYYRHRDETRRKEIDYCVSKNISSSFFKKIVIFVNSKKDLSHLDLEFIDKIKFEEGFSRISFQDIFDYCNINFHNELNVISNIDIWFENTIEYVKKIDFDKKFVCLSRWEDIQEQTYIRGESICSFSQDVWVFKTPVRIVSANFLMGIPRCDGRIAYLSKVFGYEPINPCKTIKCYHRHSSEIRNYICGVDFVDGEVLYVKPTEI